MKDPRREYEAALTDFSQPGARWQALCRLTYWGKAAGLTADGIISDARAAGVRDRDADIRRGWNSAKPQGDRMQGDWRSHAPRTKPKPAQTFPRLVRDLIGDEAEAACVDFDAVRALSPYWWPHTANPLLAQTAAFLRLFNPGDWLFIFRDDSPEAGRLGFNVRTCREWLHIVEGGGRLPGDLIVPNPFTGAEGATTEGRPSFVAQSCISRFPFLIVEFDAMPFPMQCAFWRGVLTKSPLAGNVASVTYSGGKSLHGLLHVGCATLADWQTTRDRLRGLLAADPDPAFKADEQAMRPRTGTRLPGVHRFDGGKRQELLYLNPEAVRPTSSRAGALCAGGREHETSMLEC